MSRMRLGIPGNWMRLGIRGKMIALLAVFILTLVGAHQLVVLRQNSETLRRQTRLRADSVALDLVAHSRPALLTYDHFALERIAASGLANPHVLYVVITNKEHQVVARLRRNGVAAEPETPQPVPEVGNFERTLADGTPVLDVVRRVVVEETGDSWGTVRLGLNLSPVRSEMARVHGTLMVTSLGVLLLGALGMAWLARRITRPIRLLNIRTLELVHADPASTLPTFKGDELEMLSASFEVMRTRLANERWEREALLGSLERQVEKRTAALTESEKRYRNLFERVKDAVYIADAEDRLLLVNPAAEELLGRPREELLGRQVSEFYADRRERARLLGTVYSEGLARDFEVRLVHRNGEKRRVLETCLRVEVPGVSGHTLEGIVKDVTVRHQLEEQLAQAQRMETVGTLAGGVAHDFNNILGSILGSAQLMRLDLGRPERVVELAKAIETQAERGGALTRQMLSFAKPEAPRSRPIELNGLLQEIVDFVKQALKADIETRVDLSPAPLMIMADPAQLQRAITNLALNARDAMSEGGSLTLRTRAFEVGERLGTRHPVLSRGSYAVLEVTDTGCGMSDKLRKRVFEPFFTTKTRGRGTGLGLAMVYGFVKDLGGHIEVASRPGKGSRFTLFLPQTGEQPEEQPELEVDRSQGSERILLVDDEELLRRVIKEALQSFGYQVDTAGDGLEALDRFRASRPDLVILDMLMPRMGGRQTYIKLRELDPDVRVILISGYAESDGIQDALSRGALGLLRKPFRVQELVRRVREALQPAAVAG